MKLFPWQKTRNRGRNDVPPEFQWAALRMELTTWLVTGSISVLAIGVWNGVYRMGELIHTVSEIVESDVRQEDTNIKQQATNEAQDKQIRSIEVTLARHQGYLERILSAVQENGRRIP
jgi:hypothetical protein